jgi:hypothetical protein
LDNKNIDIFLIISNKTFKIEYIDKLIEHKDEILFHIHLNLFKNVLYISHSFDTKITKKKIKSKKNNIYDLKIENNYEMLLLTEKVSKYNEDKYIINNKLFEDNEYFLNIYIKTDELKNNEYIELGFD